MCYLTIKKSKVLGEYAKYVEYLIQQVWNYAMQDMTVAKMVKWWNAYAILQRWVTDPLFKISGILKVQDLYQYQYQTTLFMFDYNNNRLPVSFNSTFKFNYQIQNIRTTRQSNLLHVARCNSNFARNLPLYVFPQIWNKWYDMISERLSRSQVKSQTKNFFLNSYHSAVKCTYVHCKDCGTK